jgi:hypothetical protein
MHQKCYDRRLTNLIQIKISRDHHDVAPSGNRRQPSSVAVTTALASHSRDISTSELMRAV